MKKCSVEGCNNKHYGKGYCRKHYDQIRRHGKIIKTKFDPNEIIEYEDYAEIILYDKNCNEIARTSIDLDDIDKMKQYKWYLHDDGYAVSDTKNKNDRMHRIITDCPKDMFVDHINHNRLDNRKCNLRICTQQQNNINTSKKKTNKSGVIGVHWAKSRKKWCAQIKVNSKTFHLGYFDNIEEAAEVRKQAEIKYFGDYRNKKDDDNE